MSMSSLFMSPPTETNMAMIEQTISVFWKILEIWKILFLSQKSCWYPPRAIPSVIPGSWFARRLEESSQLSSLLILINEIPLLHLINTLSYGSGLIEWQYQDRKNISYILRIIFKQRWFSGRILACHAGGPGSIPGRCKLFDFYSSCLNFAALKAVLKFIIVPKNTCARAGARVFAHAHAKIIETCARARTRKFLRHAHARARENFWDMRTRTHAHA